MGSTVIAYSIIGMPIDRDRLFKTVEKSVHVECVTGNGKFCMDCGRPVDGTIKELIPVDGFDPDGGEDGLGSFECGSIIMSLSNNCGKEEYFISIRCVGVSPYDKPSLLDTDGINADKKKLKRTLEPLGMWDENKFGVWCALYYS